MEVHTPEIHSMDLVAQSAAVFDGEIMGLSLQKMKISVDVSEHKSMCVYLPGINAI